MSQRPPDPDGLRYARYWEPVLAPSAHRLLARFGRAPGTFLDVGTGTGSLALAAAAHWPAARIVGLDASGGMLSVASVRAAATWPGQDRFEWLTADAAAMPLDGGAVDAAASAFVLQLVDHRPAVMREVWRVLRPGGVFAFVTWMAGEAPVVADEVFDEVVAALGFADEPAQAARPAGADMASATEAVQELEAAGFVAVEADVEQIQHVWTRPGFLEFKEAFADHDLFESLGADDRQRLRHELQRRWSELPSAAFEMRGSLVAAAGRRPDLGEPPGRGRGVRAGRSRSSDRRRSA